MSFWNRLVTAALLAFAEKCRAELGDNLVKRPSGAGTREPGRVEGEATKKKKNAG